MLANPQVESLLDAALACHEAGQLEQAEKLYRSVLQLNPDQLDALNLLGLVTQNTGRLDESIALLSRAIAVDPEFPEALTNLARAQNAAGAIEAAAANAGRAALLSSDLAEAHFQLGRALIALGRNVEAQRACQQAVTLAPHWPDPQVDLGLVLVRLGNFQEAEDVFRAALDLQGDHAAALNGLAIVCIRLRQTEAAVEHARRAVESAPNVAEFWFGLAYALHENREVEQSLAACLKVVELSPGRPDVWVLRGDNLTMLGDFDRAEHCYREALARNPTVADAMAGLARISRLKLEPDRIARLQGLVEDMSRSRHDRIAAGFALGTALDGEERYDEAFSSFARANALVREGAGQDGRSPDLVALGRRVDWLIDVFSRELFEEVGGCGDPSDLPVFVVGMPRSGTTLVEQIAASHPEVVGTGERKDVPEIATRLEGGAALRDPRAWDKVEMRREAQDYIAQLRQTARRATRVTDKLPDNILLLGHIALLWPRARIVICRRDLRDIALSCFFQNFRDGASWSSSLTDCAARVCEIERLLCHWRKVLPSATLEISYESLVNDLEGEGRRLIDFLGIEWHDSCLDFYRTERLVMGSSSWQVRQPIYSGSVGRWKNYSKHIEPLWAGLAGLVEPVNADQEQALDRSVIDVAGQHFESERPAAAEAVLRSSLARQPDFVDARVSLAKILASRGSLQSAKRILEDTTKNGRNDYAIMAQLAQVLRAMGDLKGAVAAGERACKLAPDDGDLHFSRGILYLELNAADQAASAFARTVSLLPDSFEAKLHHGIALLRLGLYHDASAALEQALEIEPDNVECLTKLGFALSSQEKYQEALVHQERAVVLAPDEPRALYGLGLTRWQGRDISGAEETCHRMLGLAPEDPQIWLLLAYSQAALGKFGEAEISYRKALEIFPDYHDAQLGLTELRRDVGDIVESEKLIAALGDATTNHSERVAAGFALGKMFEKSGQYDDAFAAYAEANRLIRVQRGRAPVPVRVAGFKQTFSPENLAAAKGLGDPSELPVFVVGMPRSGTTLVEQIIGSHPEVFAGGERKDINGLIMRLFAGDYHIPPPRWNPLQVRKEAAWHIARIQDISGDSARFVDKMPDNIQLLGHISVMLPGARVIICRRDWRDVCLSCFFRRFSDSHLDWSNDLTDLADRARGIADLIDYWKEVSPLRILEVNYEHLVMNLESETRRLLAFLGLEWDSRCLAFHETERAVLTASQWQVRQPIYSDSIGRWRLYEKHLGPLLEGLKGYVLES